MIPSPAPRLPALARTAPTARPTLTLPTDNTHEDKTMDLQPEHIDLSTPPDGLELDDQIRWFAIKMDRDGSGYRPSTTTFRGWADTVNMMRFDREQAEQEQDRVRKMAAELLDRIDSAICMLCEGPDAIGGLEAREAAIRILRNPIKSAPVKHVGEVPAHGGPVCDRCGSASAVHHIGEGFHVCVACRTVPRG